MSADISQAEDQEWEDFCNSLLVPTKAEEQQQAFLEKRAQQGLPPFKPFVPHQVEPDFEAPDGDEFYANVAQSRAAMERETNPEYMEEVDGYEAQLEGLETEKERVIQALAVASQRRPIVDYNGLDWGATVIFKKLWRISNLKALIAAAKQEIKDVEVEKQQFLNIYGAEMEAVQRAEQPRGKKSVLTSSGVVSLYFKPAGLEIADEEKCFAWCAENFEGGIKRDVRITHDGKQGAFMDELEALCQHHDVAIRSDASVSKAALNRLFKEQGILPDGCEFKVAVEELTFKPHNSKEIEVSDAE